MRLRMPHYPRLLDAAKGVIRVDDVSDRQGDVDIDDYIRAMDNLRTAVKYTMDGAPDDVIERIIKLHIEARGRHSEPGSMITKFRDLLKQNGLAIIEI